MSVDGLLESMLVHENSASVERFYAQYLLENRELQGDKMVLDGPHKSDFGMFNRALDLPVKLTSTGQQKTALLDIGARKIDTRQNIASPIDIVGRGCCPPGHRRTRTIV